MKKRIFATLLLLASIAFESSAYTILISGGGKNQRFYRIFISDKTAQCTGNGNNKCFLLEGTISTPTKTIKHNIQNVVDFVFSQVNNGNVNGEETFENDLPVSWKSERDGNVEINIENGVVEGVDYYDSEK